MNYRHGDCALIGIEKLPEGLQAANTTVLMTGSGGNDHKVLTGTVYLKQDNPDAPWGGEALIELGAKGVENPTGIDNHFGYFLAPEGNLLLHHDHGKDTGRSDGLKEVPVTGIYGLLGQYEDAHAGMVQVVD